MINTSTNDCASHCTTLETARAEKFNYVFQKNNEVQSVEIL